MAYSDPLIGETSPSDWKYVAEGGSTVVLSYQGPPNSTFNRTVLRLRKGPLHPIPDDEGGILDVGKDPNIFYQEPDDPIVVFQKEVIERLVPNDALPVLQDISVENRWLAELTALVEDNRPQARRAKDRIDITRQKAVLATDLIGGEGWCIEIKVCRSSLWSISVIVFWKLMNVSLTVSPVCSPNGVSFLRLPIYPPKRVL
jgi:inositol-pentakisphosphate 2-kinase